MEGPTGLSHTLPSNCNRVNGKEGRLLKPSFHLGTHPRPLYRQETKDEATSKVNSCDRYLCHGKATVDCVNVRTHRT